MRISEAVKRLQELNPKTVQTLTRYCRNNQIPAEVINGVWHIKDDFVMAAETWRKAKKNRFELTEEALEAAALTDDIRKKCRRNIADRTKCMPESDSPYALVFAGFFPSDESKVVDVIADSIAKYSGKQGMLQITEICDRLGYSRYVVTNALRSGEIPGKMIGNAWYASPEDVDAFMEKSNGYIGVQDTAARIAAETTTIFDPENGRDRAVLNTFLRQSKVADILVPADVLGVHGNRRNTLFYPAALKWQVEPVISAHLRYWGLAEERYELLIHDPIWNEYPETFRLVKGFAETKNKPSASAIMEILVHSLTKEITSYTDKEAIELSELAEKSITSTHERMFAKFMRYVQENSTDCAFKVDFLYDTENTRKLSINTAPYQFCSYVLSAQLVFNEDSIQKHNLVKLSIEDADVAYLWFFMVMHYIAAWRTSDIKSIRVLPLLRTAEEVVMMLKEGKYKTEAERMALLLENEINGQHIRPEKTEGVQDKYFLTIRIPESVREVVGTAYSLVVLHSRNGKIQSCRLDIALYKKIFGDDYTRIFGNEAFSNRRANKSFMNAVRDIVDADETTGRRVMGDVVASYARAHSHQDGLLAEATKYYLQTTMDGYDTNTITRLLFESGTCSFIPYMLLEAVYGDKFASLPFPNQNSAILDFGQDAAQSNFAVTILQKTYLAGRHLIDEFLRNLPPEGIKKTGQEMLEKIIHREAMTKQIGISCALSARSLPCAAVTAKDCIGCKYAILHRGALFSVMEKIQNAYDKLWTANTAGEQIKMRSMIEQRYIPAAIELLKFSKTIYGEDISEYKTQLEHLIHERGILK